MYSEAYGFSSSHVRVWELDHKEGGALMNWRFQSVVLEKTLESPLESKEIQSVNLKGNQPWILFGRTDAEAEAPILWPPDSKQLTHWKRPWRWQKEKRATEDEMVGWHHQLDGHELGQTPGHGEGQGSLASCSPRGCKESDTTWRLDKDKITCWALCSVFTSCRIVAVKMKEQVPFLPLSHGGKNEVQKGYVTYSGSHSYQRRQDANPGNLDRLHW